jgi:hypothetical protein
MPNKEKSNRMANRSQPPIFRAKTDESFAGRSAGSVLEITNTAPLTRIDPDKLSSQDYLTLQRVIGNEAVGRMIQTTGTVQRDDDMTRTPISQTTDTGNKYTQDLLLNKTKARITISLGVNWVKKGTWANDEAYERFIRRVKTAAYSYLDNKFKVVCRPTAEGAGPATIELPIDFLIYDTPSGYQIEVHGGTPGGGSSMSTTGGEVYEYRSDDSAEIDITYAHEFGHAILGASDEYANPSVPGRVLTNDHSIMANYYAQGIDQAEFKARHFQHIVTAVAGAFAGYTCSLEEM